MGVSAFVKSNELYDKDNKQRFVLDERPAAKQLRTLLGNPSETVTYFNLQRYLKHHYTATAATDKPVVPKVEKKAKAEPVPETPKKAAAPASEPVPETPVKKTTKIMVKKKKELTEEA
jgi:hypothetical protein